VSEEHDPILEHLVAGWQKIVDCRQYGDTIYVFRSQTPVGYSAVMNKAQVIGPIIREIKQCADLPAGSTRPPPRSTSIC
jgi:hypothetical protein